MKKTIKLFLLAVAAIFAAAAGIGIIYIFPLLSINPAETGKIFGTNIYAVKNRMGAVYFIPVNNGYIMVDSGSDAKKLESSLKEEGINTDDVKWILLTHSDADHTAGLALFPNAKIYMNEDELPLINGTAKRSFFGGNTLPKGIDTGGIVLLSGNQELSCNGINVKCIKAPGHTAGSMVYLVDGMYLFTGDAFKVKNGSMGVHPYTMDAALSKKTMEQLKNVITNSSKILTSHYGYYEKLE